MKVFTMRVAMVAGNPTTKDVTLNMSMDEIKLCLQGLKLLKASPNDVLQSVKESLVLSLEDIK